MKYALTVVVTAAVLIASAAILNWVVDPAGVFRTTSFGKQYAQELMVSEHGLASPPSFDEREYKTQLAELATASDCVVIGSSRIMQVGSQRKYRAFPVCEHILNLGVSGAVIQDHVVLSWLALTKGKSRKLILGIDPWTFSYGNDERWKIRYAEQYPLARKDIEGDDDKAITANRWSNLINAQYTKRSLEHLLSGTRAYSIERMASVNEDVGEKTAVILPDGSLVYSAKYISESRNAVIPIGANAYKVDGLDNDPRAIRLYYKLIRYAKAIGARVTLLMSPYHQNAWALRTSSNTKAMESVEAIVRNMANELEVAVVGSYRPESVGCRPDEFFDLIHPQASCMARFTATSK